MTAIHPHVVMEDGTKYEIQVDLPTGLIGKWSSERTKSIVDEFGIRKPGYEGMGEVYQEQTTLGVIIKIDGKPGGEIQTGGELPARRIESFVTFRPDEDEAERDLYDTYVASRTSISQATKKEHLEKNEYETTDWAMQCKVQESKGKKVMLILIPRMDAYKLFLCRCLWQNERFGIISRSHSPGEFGIMRSAPLLQGETIPIDPKKSLKKITQVKYVHRLAEANLVLVGQGGSIKDEITEVPPG